MLFDKQNMFSEDQAVTVTADSTNVIKTDAGTGDSGKSYPKIAVRITETFATLTSLTISLVVGATTSPATTIWTSPAITLAGGGLAVGSIHDYVAPLGMSKYAKLVYTVAGSTATAGKVNAGFVFDAQTNG